MPPRKSAAGPSSGGGKALVGLLGLVLGLVVGYGAGRVSTGTPINPLAPAATQEPAAGEGVVPGSLEAGLFPPPLEESSALSGTAVAVTATSLTFDADLMPFDPLGEKDLPKRRVAQLTADTQIVRLVEKTPQELTAEQEAFVEASAEASPDSPPPPPPLPFREVRIAAADIAVGESITVEAAEDIVKAETFTAIRVVVAPKTAAPPQELPPPAAPEPPPEPAPTP